MFQYFETILPSVESVWSFNKMRYILGKVALPEACDANNMVAILDFTKK